MNDDEDIEVDGSVVYDDSGYPGVSYLDKNACIIQAVGSFIAQIGKCPPGHPVIAPAIEWLQSIKPPQLTAIKGGKD
jgi:hypothetical protein